MRVHCGCEILRQGGVYLCALTLCWSVAAAEQKGDAIPGDAKIVAKELHSFVDGGKRVSVVLGGFELLLGKTVISGRDAVLWIEQQTIEKTTGHRIVAYIEGGVKVVEPPTAPGDAPRTTTDRVMLVMVRHQGRLSTPRVVENPQLKESALYKRALAQRDRSEKREQELAKTQPAKPVRHAPPPLIRTERPKPPREAAKPLTSRPGPGREEPPTTQPAEEARPILPVYFHADEFHSKPPVEGRRATIARGNVYLSQGHPESDLFLELRSQSAVIISQRPDKDRPVPKKDSRSPYSPKLSPDAPEGIVGVYLEGDVVISRGERFLRGPRAFYDFTADRAIMPNAVFRTIQTQRGVPVIIRAVEARTLSARESLFRDAKVTTSDFYTPTYHIGAKRVYLMDTAPYDEKGVRLSPQRYLAKMEQQTVNIRGLPIFYSPYVQTEVEQGHTALRKAQVGYDSREGFGVETQWHLFRLLGLVSPEDVSARLTLKWYEGSFAAGIDYDYERENFSGYGTLYGLVDEEEEDEFGQERESVEAPKTRGRVLVRHKQFLRDDWQLQFELSYICDRNFLESEFPDEFHAGKEQETLLYAKKQRDNWALTSLLQARLNRFDSQAESFPEFGFHLIGQPLLDDLLTYFGESRLGLKRWRPANHLVGDAGEDSNVMVRADTRHELDWPLKYGPYNIVPFTMTRMTYWSDEPPDGENFRPYVQAGLRANTHIWRVYDDFHSRLWDVDRLKHIITPEVTAFFGWAGDVQPRNLYPMDPDIETHIGGLSGATLGVHQRWQTKRGRDFEGKPTTVDWMRLAVVAGFYDSRFKQIRSDGQFFAYRPEHSIGRNHVNVDYTWNISDATALLADMNIDIDRGIIGRSGVTLAVARDPRVRYLLGLRTIEDMDSAVGTFGVRYRLNKKYTLSFFEQYDFEYKGGTNSITSVGIIRKLPRWYVGVTVTYDARYEDLSLWLNFWPEGISEVEIRTGRMRLLSRSDKN